MSIQHFKSLLFKSTQLQQEIERENRRRWPDWMRLLKLKKLRLAIKDRLQGIIHEDTNYQLKRVPVKAQSARHNLQKT